MTKSITVTIPTQQSQYEVTIGASIIYNIGKIISNISPHQAAALVIDEQLTTSFLQPIQTSLSQFGYRNITVCPIPAGEKNKTLATVHHLYQHFLAGHLERTTPVIAVGGGVIGDTAGFAAATFLRGLPFINIPTTLLAMVDASVGGKTGVNIELPAGGVGKNLIGAFHQPAAVIMDINTLKTLPKRHQNAGLAECVKHGLIADPDLFTHLQTNVSKFTDWSDHDTINFITRNVQIKADIVQRDVKESNLRMVLNLGHSFAHAIEPIADLNLTHVEAVALGLVAAAETGVYLKMTDPILPDCIRKTLQQINLPTHLPNLPAFPDNEALLKLMRTDKKVRDNNIRLIIPTQLGRVEIVDDVPDSAIKAGWEALRS